MSIMPVHWSLLMIHYIALLSPLTGCTWDLSHHLTWDQYVSPDITAKDDSLSSHVTLLWCQCSMVQGHWGTILEWNILVASSVMELSPLRIRVSAVSIILSTSGKLRRPWPGLSLSLIFSNSSSGAVGGGIIKKPGSTCVSNEQWCGSHVSGRHYCPGGDSKWVWDCH